MRFVFVHLNLKDSTNEGPIWGTFARRAPSAVWQMSQLLNRGAPVTPGSGAAGQQFAVAWRSRRSVNGLIQHWLDRLRQISADPQDIKLCAVPPMHVGER